MIIKCKGCNKQPHEITSVKYNAMVEGESPEDFVKYNEGTFNEKTGLFYCNECYVKAGMPLGRA